MITVKGAVVGGEFDVDIYVEDGVITAIDRELTPKGEVLNAEGGLVTAPFAEPHIHLDAALLGAERPNVSGTLFEGISNWSVARGDLTVDDLQFRAKKAIRWCLAHGTTRVRTHVDTGSKLGIEAMLDLRDQVADYCDLQIVAFPQEGIYRAETQAEALEWAVAKGVDAVGAIPHFEKDRGLGDKSVKYVFDLAERYGAQIDLHCDESDDPSCRHLITLCRERIRRGFEAHVIAGHCTAMHSYPDDVAKEAIELTVKSGVQVVANPLDNIVLQGRGDGYPRRRGITRVPELIEAGAAIGIGHDSIMDPWYPLGVGNLLNAASMLAHVAQMTTPVWFERIVEVLISDNHAAWGGPPEIVVGAPAEFIVHNSSDHETILRVAEAPRWVVKGGQIVASTTPAKSSVMGSMVTPGRV